MAETLESIASLFGFGEKQPLQPPRFAKVQAVSGDTVSVIIGQTPADAVRCCACAAGDVVLLETLPNGTLAAVGARGASGGGSVPQNLTYYGTCSTAAGTTAKVVTCSGFVLATGATIHVLFTVANTVAAPTLNVNGTGAKATALRSAATGTSNALYWAAGDNVTFVYDGSYWRAVSNSGYIYSTRARLASANTTTIGSCSMRHFLATSSMTEGKPMGDGHIIECDWDNTNADHAQLYLPIGPPSHTTTWPQWRSQKGGANTWTAWDTFYTEANPPTTEEISGTYTDGIWTVRKWADGTAECWGSYDYTIASWNQWGSMYVSATYASHAYPSGLFISKPIESALVETTGLDGWTGVLHGSGSATTTRTYYIVRPTAGSANLPATFTVRAVGRWK